MQLPVGRIHALGSEAELEYAFRSLAERGAELRHQVPVVVAAAMVILGLCRSVERKPPIQRCPGPDVCVAHVFAQRVVKAVLRRKRVALSATVVRMLVLNPVAELPVAQTMLLVDIYAVSVYVLTV